MRRVTIDEERCIGSGECVLSAPGSFELRGEGYAVPLPPAHALSSEELAQIVGGCPSGAISVIEIHPQGDANGVSSPEPT